MDPAPAVYAALDALGIAYERYEHPAVFTAEDASTHWNPIPGTQCKNLFLRNKKGDRHYLVVLEISKRADLKDLVRLLGDDRLSFGSPERLMDRLGLTPGSVSPFGLINDADGSVRVLIDRDLKGAERLIFHPNINTASVVVSWSDLERFLATRKNSLSMISI
ncbi:MAG TPA: prolyl-tRNA synthetase associated domain-containing protein [Vicinamibacterales bacterium]|jgi:Ala-tRNA(Pro) deacylase|nr:prolyl-tRNA synthetase associated domain-containing protein [Vicinamibacterales bacterium]